MKIIERVFDSNTNETTDIERTLTADELTIYQANILLAEQKTQAEAEKVAAKAAAEAKLAALGLTSDDLKALGLGGN